MISLFTYPLFIFFSSASISLHVQYPAILSAPTTTRFSSCPSWLRGLIAFCFFSQPSAHFTVSSQLQQIKHILLNLPFSLRVLRGLIFFNFSLCHQPFHFSFFCFVSKLITNISGYRFKRFYYNFRFFNHFNDMETKRGFKRL